MSDLPYLLLMLGFQLGIHLFISGLRHQRADSIDLLLELLNIFIELPDDKISFDFVLHIFLCSKQKERVILKHLDFFVSSFIFQVTSTLKTIDISQSSLILHNKLLVWLCKSSRFSVNEISSALVKCIISGLRCANSFLNRSSEQWTNTNVIHIIQKEKLHN